MSGPRAATSPRSVAEAPAAEIADSRGIYVLGKALDVAEGVSALDGAQRQSSVAGMVVSGLASPQRDSPQ